MFKRISAVAMMILAAAVMVLVPVQNESAIKTSTGTKEQTSVTTPSETTTFTATTAPETDSDGTESTSKSQTTVGNANKNTNSKDTAVATTKKTTAKTTTAKTTKKTATTTKKTTAKAPSGTPVQQHGQLSVSGVNIVDKNGDMFQLLGMSTHGIGWFPDAVSKASFQVLRDDWGCNIVRLAMYIEESWGGSESCYLQDKDRNYNLVIEGIDACIDLGMYVVVDWHVLNPGDPSAHTAEAQAFFEKIAKKYKDSPNIIYEICNEPNGNVTWDGQIKPYAEKVIKSIRKYDSDAIIVCGTPTWSQDIDKVLNNKLSDKNTVYALHFYANTHTDWLRDRLTTCYNKGLPVLVTEFGTCDASGNGGFNESQTRTWTNLLDKYNIGYMNWSFGNKPETASAFVDGTDMSNIQAGTSQLTESGKLIREIFRKRAGLA